MLRTFVGRSLSATLLTTTVLSAALLGGCAATMAEPATSAAAAPMAAEPMAATGPGVANPEIWPTPTWPLPRQAATEQRIKALIARMTLEEKIGQVVQGDITTVTAEDVRKYNLGSVLNGGNSGPYNDDLAPREKWLQLADEYYAASVDTSDGGVGIPVIWGTDAVHGHSNIIGATLFPHNIGLGAANDTDLILRIGRATALEIRTTGQEWTFAPTLTVPRDFRWGRAYEGYSSDPALVSRYAASMIEGLQGKPSATPMLDGPYVIASTKHFLADGGTTDGKDQGDAAISEVELRDVHGAPYVPAIEQGVATVMASFSSWNGVKMTGNKSLLNDVLKERMNFDGFIVSDWNAHGQVPGCSNARCPQALLAGLDMYMAPDTWKDIYNSLLEDARAGKLPMERLDDAVARILRVKLRVGLFEAGKPSARRYAGQWDLLGAPAHREVAREAVRKSLVLLKNSGSALPIRPGARVLVAGDAADDVARQSGGWTLTWQGTGVDNRYFPGATSIHKGIADAVSAAGGTATLSPNGRYTRKPDVAVVVFGETPYAEFQGDRKTLQLPAELRGSYATMQRLKAEGVPVVAVMITGRPLFMNPELNAADAFVVAWLPGSEGQGVADLLVAGRDGKPRFDFTGRLPVDWPITADAKGANLYPLGYGLSFADRRTWAALPEDPGVAGDDSGTVWFANGQPAASWSLIVGEGFDTGTRITTVPAEASSGAIRVTAVDAGVQEGARQFSMAAGTSGIIGLLTQSPVNIERENNADVLLTFSMRVDGPLSAPLALSMQCAGAGCASSIPVTDLAPAGSWATYAVPLKCFARKGVDMTKVRGPFALLATGPAKISLARVALGTTFDRQLPCPA